MTTILVTGASGQQGAAVMRHLLAQGHGVRAMLRDVEGDAARQLTTRGCEVVPGDLDRPETLLPALDGVSAAFLVLALSDEATEVRRGQNLIQAARQADLDYLLFSAALDANHSTGVPHFDSKYRLIRELAESGLHHSVLGPGGFMENLLFPRTWNGLSRGRLVTPFRVDVPQAMVAVDDIGRFAACYLTQPPEESGSFVPLYSDCLSSREQARIISRELDRSVQAKRLPWLLTRLFLGGQLTTMFDYYNRGRAPTPPDNRVFVQTLGSVTGFRDWLAKQTPPE